MSLTLTIMPHEQLCPDGAEITIKPDNKTSICDILLDHNIDIEHACEQSCACTTCHVIIRQGFSSLGKMSDLEEDLLDQAWGLEHESRLSCQAIPNEETTHLTIEIPKYTINHARE
jgi:2Fe-2S ferredoxin